MRDEVDVLSDEALAAAFYTEVLGEAKPGRKICRLPVVCSSELWDFVIVEHLTDGFARIEWQPVPLDGNQMMRGVWVMVERGYIREVETGKRTGKGTSVATFSRWEEEFWVGAAETEEIATARAE